MNFIHTVESFASGDSEYQPPEPAPPAFPDPTQPAPQGPTEPEVPPPDPPAHPEPPVARALDTGSACLPVAAENRVAGDD